MTTNMTSGSPAKLILRFMAPLLIGNLFQQFYNIADTLIVGQTIGVDALAAVGSSGAIMFLIQGFAGGLTSGFAIVTARRFGAGNMAAVRRSFVVSALLSLAISIILTFGCAPFSRNLLELMRTPPGILDAANSYTSVILWGMVLGVFSNLLSNVLRAMGDSRMPLVFLVVACIINVVLDFVFILHFNMGVAGAAWATLAAQLVSVLLCILYIWRKVPLLRLQREDFVVTRQDVYEHLKMGLPMGFQTSIIALGAMVVQFAINGLGQLPVAAFTTASKINSFAVAPLMSFGITMGTYVAQNFGAGQYRRIHAGIRQCVAMAVPFSLFMGLVFLLFGKPLAAVFLGEEIAAIEMASTHLVICGMLSFLLAVLFIIRYSLQGLGHSLVPTVAGVVEVVMRFFAALVLAQYFGYIGICFAEPLAWLGSGVTLTLAYVKAMKLMPKEDVPCPEHV